MGKFCRFLFLLFLSANLYAQTFYIDIEEFNRTQMEFVMEIVDRDYERVMLDCQGFINMVSIEHYDGRRNNLVLDIGECPQIFRSIQKNINNNLPSCLETNLDNRTFNVQSEYCD